MPLFSNFSKSNRIFLELWMVLLITLLNGQSVQAAQCDVNSVTTGAMPFDSPGAMVATPDDKWLLAIDENAMDIKVISTTEQPEVVSTVFLQGLEPSSLTVSADGTRLYIGGAFNTGIAVVDISASDPALWQVVNTWNISGDFTALLFDSTTPRLLVADRNTQGVMVLSHTDGNQLATLTVPNGGCSLPSALAIKGTQLFVACETNGIVAVFDLTTLSYLQDINVSSPVALFAHPSAEQVFVANDASVSIINTTALGRTPDPIPDPTNLLTVPRAMAWLGGELWILEQSQSTLVRYNTNGQLEASVCEGLGSRPHHLVVLPSSGLLYIANSTGVNYISVKANRRVKNPPQVLMAGVDPMLLNSCDKEISMRVLAVVEQGAQRINNVGLRHNSSLIYHEMNLVGVIPLNPEESRHGLVYEKVMNLYSPAEFCYPEGPLAKQQGFYSYSLFGNHRSQLSITARDSFQIPHSYPRWRYGEWPFSEVTTPGMASNYQNYNQHGTYRDKPQVIMAGFSPMLMDSREDQEVKVMAIVRPAYSEDNTEIPIQSVTLNRFQTDINVAMNNQIAEMDQMLVLQNGDYLYQGIVPKTELDLSEEKKDFATMWNDTYTVIVRDSNNQHHRFPEVTVGNYPAR